MTDTAIATKPQEYDKIIESLVIGGDLSKLTPAQKVQYYNATCESLGLNPLTRPFEYMKLQGKESLYPGKNCADQLRKINSINIEVVEQSVSEGLLTIHVRAKDKTGRIDEDFGVVSVVGLRGEAAANAFMKAITKGKRRVTLSICGLFGPDDSEIDGIPGAERVEPFRHLTKPVAVSEPPKNNPPQDDADTDEPPIETSDEYVQRWEVLIENAIDPDKLLTQWKDEQLLRGEIDWPDSQIPPRLRDKVKARREQLQSGHDTR